MSKVSAAELRSIMDASIGSEAYYKAGFAIVMTDGMKAVCEAAGAFWVLGLIDSYVVTKKNIKNASLLFWKLTVKNADAVIECVEDSGKKPLVRQKIGYTDFPDGDWTFYQQKNYNEDGSFVVVVHVPAEY